MGTVKTASNFMDIKNKILEDSQKEMATQRYAKELISLFFVIVAASLTALAIPLGAVWMMELANLLTVVEVISGTLTLEFIGMTAVLSVILFLLRKKVPWLMR